MNTEWAPERCVSSAENRPWLGDPPLCAFCLLALPAITAAHGAFRSGAFRALPEAEDVCFRHQVRHRWALIEKSPQQQHKHWKVGLFSLYLFEQLILLPSLLMQRFRYLCKYAYDFKFECFSEMHCRMVASISWMHQASIDGCIDDKYRSF